MMCQRNCDFGNCAFCKETGGNCAFAYVDLGIAASSAVTISAADMVDCWVMFSIGKTAMQLPFADDDVLWLGIPLSISGKNIFFDRNMLHN